MPTIDHKLAFVLATTALLLIPGPNVALIVANSVAYGPRYGLLTVAGTSSAVVVQLALIGLGLTELLGAAGAWLPWLKWAGVAYLLYLAVSQLIAPADDLTAVRPQPESATGLYARGLLVALTNPKTLAFYVAFFPQFIRPGDDVRRQLAILSVTFLILAVVIDSTWAIVGARARGLLAGRGRLRNRLAGCLLMAAAAALALTRA